MMESFTEISLHLGHLHSVWVVVKSFTCLDMVFGLTGPVLGSYVGSYNLFVVVRLYSLSLVVW